MFFFSTSSILCCQMNCRQMVVADWVVITGIWMNWTGGHANCIATVCDNNIVSVGVCCELE